MEMKNIKIIFAIFAFIFTISAVDASAQRSVKTNKRTAQKVQNIRINVTQNGYRPESFRLKKGVPARITFIRTTDDDCGSEVVIPAYGIKRQLPLNKPVTVRFTPRKAGTFNFVCGMDMLRGKIIVQ
jgi:plastocyanin domain-containing protein